MTLAAWIDTQPDPDRQAEPLPIPRRADRIIASIQTDPTEDDHDHYTAMAMIGTRWRSLIDQRTRLPARFPTAAQAHGAAAIAAHVHDAGDHADHWAYR